MYTPSCAGELLLRGNTNIFKIANTVLVHRVASRKETLAFFSLWVIFKCAGFAVFNC